LSTFRYKRVYHPVIFEVRNGVTLQPLEEIFGGEGREMSRLEGGSESGDERLDGIDIVITIRCSHKMIPWIGK